MKIGVVTFWQSKDNYGQHLQSFALQTYLKKMGHEPFLIRYKENPQQSAHFQLKNICKYVTKMPTYIKFILNQRKEKQNAVVWQQQGGQEQRNLHGFLADNVMLTSIMTEQELLANPPQADAYICGSDQIWAGPAPYYLSFAPDDAKKIAYAPSLGGLTHFKSEYEAMMIRLMKRLDFIGMREQSGVEVCHRLGFKEAVKVVDPTLLLRKEDYDKIKCNVKKDKPYAFWGLLGNPTTCSIASVMEFVKKRDLDYVYVPSQNRMDNFEKLFATMGEWIGYLSNADVVITNSFHCTVFSLIYHRPFITLKLNNGYERMNTRVEELLLLSKLDSQFIDDDINLANICNLDFSEFDSYRESEEKRSRNYLKTHLL